MHSDVPGDEMGYHEMSIRNTGTSGEALAGRLRDFGATGFIEREGELLTYFGNQEDAEQAAAELENFREVLAVSGLDTAYTVSVRPMPDQDWNEVWKKNFVPIDLGRSLSIVPSWVTPGPGRIPVIIDPGMVFGTGHHASTRACLVFVEKVAERSPKRRLLDIGTGSGILAIAGARLGFGEVVAVDTDPLAVENARLNISLNGLENMRVIEGDVSAVSGSFDLITANLLSEILTAIAPEIAARLHRGGSVIASGMLPGQEAGVIRAMEAAGLVLEERSEDETWITLLLSGPHS